MSDPPSNEALLEPMCYTRGATTRWNGSWQRLYDHLAQAILAFARQQGLNDASSEDVVQEVMTALIRSQHGQAAGYDRGVGSFQSWLWGIIRNRVRALLRKDRKEPPSALPQPGEGATQTRAGFLELPQAPEEVEGREEAQWRRALLAAAILKVRERVTPDNFSIFTALIEERATAESLARKYGRDTNAIYAARHRCEKMVISEARALRELWEQLDQPPPST